MKNPRSAQGLAQDNKGSAIIAVVVSMLFIMALGAALLFASYTAYKIALIEREDKEIFYTAESAMDDVRVGLQGEVTRALAVSYTEALTECFNSNDPEYDPQAYFAQAFKAELFKSSVTLEGQAQSACIFYSSSYGAAENVSYMPAALCSFIAAPGNSSVSVGSAGSFDEAPVYSGQVRLTFDEGGRLSALTLRAVSLKYTENGYESNITADIKVAVPDFYAKPILSEGLNSYAIVANGGLIKSSGGRSTVYGRVYAGGVDVYGSGNMLKVTEGSLISPKEIGVSNGAEFIFSSAENELWASDLTLGENSTASIKGRAYVADDLRLDKGSSATLSGSYFGFGSTAGSPNQSSAILVNGKGASLDISELDKLALAGVSFIDIMNGGLTSRENNGDYSSYGTPIPMGESMSVKSNQLAYLVPIECIQNYASNPCVFNGGDVEAPACSMSAVLWTIGGEDKTLDSYIGGGKGQIKALYKNLDGGTIKLAYVFILFNKQEYANKYFRDYFEAYPDRINQYLNFYLQLSDKADGADISAAGNTFFVDDKGTASTGDDALTLVPAVTALWSQGLKARFSGLRSPYADFVNKKNLGELSANTRLEFVKKGKVVAIVTNEASYTHISYPGDTARLIISSGNVSVSGDFKGVVLADGAVTIDGSGTVAAQPLESGLLDALAATGETEYELTDFVNVSGLTASTVDDGNSWAPGKLVFYENWTKN